MIYTGALTIGGFVGSFTWLPGAADGAQEWASEPAMIAVKDLGQLVMGLEVLDTRKSELNNDRDDIEDNIKALELKLENPSIVGQHRKDLERQIESERKRLYQILQRLNQAKEYDLQIIEELEKSYS